MTAETSKTAAPFTSHARGHLARDLAVVLMALALTGAFIGHALWPTGAGSAASDPVAMAAR